MMSSGLIFLTLALTFMSVVPFFVVTLVFAVSYSTLCEIIRGQLNCHAIAWHDLDKVLAHLTSHVGYYFVSVFKLDPELSTGQHLNDDPTQLNDLLVTRHI
jgi:hypothetical protein